MLFINEKEDTVTLCAPRGGRKDFELQMQDALCHLVRNIPPLPDNDETAQLFYVFGAILEGINNSLHNKLAEAVANESEIVINIPVAPECIPLLPKAILALVKTIRERDGDNAAINFALPLYMEFAEMLTLDYDNFWKMWLCVKECKKENEFLHPVLTKLAA